MSTVSQSKSRSAKSIRAADGPPRPRGSGSQIVYEALRKSILELTLAPASPLDEASLSEQFDMSRTPIREALVRLAGEGLVATLPNRSTIVAPVNFTGMPVYFEALKLMYRVTTTLAAQHRKPEHMAIIRSRESAFVDAVKRRDALDMISANRDFHMAIADAGGNTYFNAFFSRLLDEGRRLLRLYYSSFDDRLPKQYQVEHDQMIAAIEAGEVDLADRLATAHATQIMQQIQSYLARNSNGDIKLDFAQRSA
jgi:DNA-binding GntR family transcriptional regulator